MKDVNGVTVAGRLTRDAELKYTNSGFAILQFSVANNYSKKVGDRWEDEANFFDVKVLGKMGEAIAQYMLKGKQVFIQGALRQERWKTNEGENRSKILIMAEHVQLVGGARDERPEAPSSDDVAPWERPPDGDVLDFQDDVPF